jgi:hypothetical protein
MTDNYSVRMLALAMAHLRQRMRDDRGIATMMESGALAVKVKDRGLLARDASDDFRRDLRKRIREAEELLERAAFSISDASLVDAFEETKGDGPDAEALLAEIRQRGLLRA